MRILQVAFFAAISMVGFSWMLETMVNPEKRTLALLHFLVGLAIAVFGFIGVLLTL